MHGQREIHFHSQEVSFPAFRASFRSDTGGIGADRVAMSIDSDALLKRPFYVDAITRHSLCPNPAAVPSCVVVSKPANLTGNVDCHCHTAACYAIQANPHTP